MHTIGASAMMEFEELSILSHKLEDMFALIRDGKDPGAAWPALFDVMFSSVSFFNAEMAKLLEKEPPNGDSAPLRARVEALVQRIIGGTGEQDAPPAADAAEAVVEAEEAAPEEAESAAVDAQEGAPGGGGLLQGRRHV